MRIKAYIFNWLDHGKNAAALRDACLLAGLDTQVISSTVPGTHPEFTEFHPDELNFFGAHFQYAKDDFLRSGVDVMIQIQADAKIKSPSDVKTFVDGLKTIDGRWGIAAPKVYFTWHTSSISALDTRYRHVFCTDSIFWALRREVVAAIPDTRHNKLGWGIDISLSNLSRNMGLAVVRDMRVTVSHPRSTGYSTAEAFEGMVQYIDGVQYPKDKQDRTGDFAAYVFGWGKYAEAQDKMVSRLRAAGAYAKAVRSFADERKGEINLGEDAYFTAQFVAMCKDFLSTKKKYLLHIQADATFDGDIKELFTKAYFGFNSLCAGVWAPNVDFTYHTPKHSPVTKDVWIVPCTDCTAWAIRREVVEYFMANINTEGSTLGWGIDEGICGISNKLGYLTLRDYSLKFDHPNYTGYNGDIAAEEVNILHSQYRKLGIRLPSQAAPIIESPH